MSSITTTTLPSSVPQVIPPSPTKSEPSSAEPENNTSKNNAHSRRKKSSSLPSETVEYLKAWMMSPEHINHPYPTEQEKTRIMEDTGIELKQLTNWFVNNRKRYWKPRVEARLQQQARQVAAAAAAAAAAVSKPETVEMHMRLNNVINGGPMLAMPPSAVTPIVFHQNHALVPSFIHSDAHHSFTAVSSPLGTMQQTPPRAFMNSQPIMFVAHPVSDSSQSTSCESDNSISNDDEETCYNSADIQFAHDSQQAGKESSEVLPSNVIQDVDSSSGMITRRETIHVFITRPNKNVLPTTDNIFVSSDVPTTSAVEKTFRDCQITYCYERNVATDKEKISKLRNAELSKMKEYCLELYLNEINRPNKLPCGEGPSGSNNIIHNSLSSTSNQDLSSGCIKNKFDESVVTNFKQTHFLPPNKRRPLDVLADTAEVQNESSPKKQRVVKRINYYKQGTKDWRDVCSNARVTYDYSLPSLDEATHMFGFSSTYQSDFCQKE